MRKPRSWAARRGLVAAAVVMAGSLSMVPTAGAAYNNGDKTVALRVTWKGVPAKTLVRFTDVTGNCDKDKRSPSFETWTDNQQSYDYLFVAKATGSCAFDASNARFRVSLTARTSAEASVIVLIAQPKAGASYGAYCDRPEGVACASGGEEKNDSRSVAVQMSIGPITRTVVPKEPGYTFCAVEGGFCVGPGKATVAFGAGDTFVYGPGASWGTQTRTECTATSFGARDPAPGRRKACFVKS